MDEHAQLRVLLHLAETAGIAVRGAPPSAEEGGERSAGALVKLRGREILFLNADASVAERLALVASVLKGRPAVEDVFLPPEIRQRLEES